MVCVSPTTAVPLSADYEEGDGAERGALLVATVDNSYLTLDQGARAARPDRLLIPG